MGKIWIIVMREYLTRVRNRTFIVMCLIAPLLVAGTFFVSQKLKEHEGAPRTIVIVDHSGMPDTVSYAFDFKDTMNLRFNFDYVYRPREEVKKLFADSANTSILWFPENFMGADTTGQYGVGTTVKLISTSDPGINTVNLLQAILSREVQRDMMKVNNISQRAIDLTLRKVAVANEVNGKISDSEIKAGVGFAFGFVIYMYILIFGVLVMRSVVEEKTTRIVEVIISSVRPFQLMLGKIIGVTMVGITQLLVWLILSVVIITPVINSVQDKHLDYTRLATQQVNTGVVVESNKSLISIDPTQKTQEVVDGILSISWGNLIPAFFGYFFFGYLLYASLFAAIGSAADIEADTQQFTFPVTVPLIIAMIASANVLNDPNGPIATWLSMIPFTSPIAMLMRMPYGGVTPAELWTSMGILIATFFFMVWLAGRIYRVGILMYGKKTSWKELGKWIFYKA